MVLSMRLRLRPMMEAAATITKRTTSAQSGVGRERGVNIHTNE